MRKLKIIIVFVSYTLNFLFSFTKNGIQDHLSYFSFQSSLRSWNPRFTSKLLFSLRDTQSSFPRKRKSWYSRICFSFCHVYHFTLFQIANKISLSHDFQIHGTTQKNIVQFHLLHYFFVNKCQISRIQSTSDDPRIIIIQSSNFNPQTLKKSCSIGISTINTCPMKITTTMTSNP